MRLYHTGFEEIREPDVHRGRKNADFGQGFYLSPDLDFSKRWARVRRGSDTVLNAYELDSTDLKVHVFERSIEWFEYIYGNRRLQPDTLDADVITGPIANDTIYDTLGITTSGFLTKEQSLQLLMIGPVYTQTVLKTEKAAAHLRWTGSVILDEETINGCRETVRKEESEYLKEFGCLLERI